MERTGLECGAIFSRRRGPPFTTTLNGSFPDLSTSALWWEPTLNGGAFLGPEWLFLAVNRVIAPASEIDPKRSKYISHIAFNPAA